MNGGVPTLDMATRRQFITGVITSGATLALGISCTRQQPGAMGTSDVDRAAVDAFRASLQGRLILPDDRSYETAQRIFFWNSRTARRPAMIAQCAGADDVARAIEFAHGHRMPVAVRAGGHSFLGWSTGDGLVIDVSPMKAIAVDPGKRTVRAGAGVTSGELVAATARYGLAPVVAQVSSVGIAGLTLGGGLSWLSGRYGAVCDNLLLAELLTADGRAITADATRNPDLFWALRGAGANVGVTTAFEYQLHPLPDIVAGTFAYPMRDARAVLHFFRDFMAEAPDELQAYAWFGWLPGGDRSVEIVLCYSGNSNDAEGVIRPLRAVANPVLDSVRRRSYADVLDLRADRGESVTTAFSAVKGTYLEQLSGPAIDVVLDHTARAPRGCMMGLDHYMHGAICRIAPDATAFSLRPAGALHVWIAALWDDPLLEAPCTTWIDDTWTALQPYTGGRIYANYQSVEGDAANKAVYGASYSRVTSIKRKYDPTRFFQRNQNIRP